MKNSGENFSNYFIKGYTKLHKIQPIYRDTWRINNEHLCEEIKENKQ
jgi:hypothetical protein